MGGKLGSVCAIVLVASLILTTAGVATGAEAPVARLSVAVTDSGGGSAELDRDCTYTVVVSNTGDVDVTDIDVDDTFLGHVGSIAALPPGESATLTKVVVMREPGAGVCTARGRGPEGEEVAASYQHSVEIFIGDAFTDLAVSKKVVSGSAVPGGSLRYRVVVANRGSDPVDEDAKTLELVDDFDQNRTTVLDAGGATISAGRLIWTVDVPAPGKWVTVEYALRVKADASGTIVNTVSANYSLDLSAGNNTATVRTPVVQPTVDQVAEEPPGTSGPGVATAAVGSSDEEPFLPFTGTDRSRHLEFALAFLILGFATRAAASEVRV